MHTLPASASRSSPHTMYVFFGVVWRVVLDDPVNLRDIQTSRSYVSAQQNTLKRCRWKVRNKKTGDICHTTIKINNRQSRHWPTYQHLATVRFSNLGLQHTNLIGFAKLEKCCGSFLLFLLAVNVHDLDIDVIQKLRVKLHRTAGREENLKG